MAETNPGSRAAGRQQRHTAGNGLTIVRPNRFDFVFALSNIPAHTYLGNNTGSTGPVLQITASQLRADIGLEIGSNVQAWDGDLDALAALSGTNNIYYRSAANTWTSVTIGTGLGFSAGTLAITDAELTAIAALTSAADRLPYYTGSGTAALATFTSFARGLLDDADAATALGTLGAAPLASPTFTGNPAAPTQAGGTNNTTLATTAFVQAAVSAGSPDPELQALAALVSAADRLPYFTGSGTASLAVFTTFARSILDDADAVTVRATLGVTIGTNVQAWDADLDAIAALSGTNTIYYRSGTNAWSAVTMGTGLGFSAGALAITDLELTALAGLTSAADRLPYFTGSGTAALAVFTAFGRTLVDDADATAARSTLGLVIGTDVAPVASPTFTGVPAAPTASPGTSTTQIATTAFVAAAVSAAGGGDVSGPASAVDDNIPMFNGTTGKLIEDSLIRASFVRANAVTLHAFAGGI